MTQTSQQIVTPAGRLVQGNLYELKNTDATGAPLLIKNGPNAGQIREDCFFAIAIPKTPGLDWRQEQWAQSLLAAAQEGFPQGQFNNPDFAYKLTDGDSQVVDQRGKRPCDKVGFAGHWVIRFNSGYLPKILNREGTAELGEKGMVNLGDYVQVLADVKPNGSMQKPGIYINHKAVAFVGYGERIAYEADYSSVGFGGGAMPAGATMTPPAGSFSAQAPAVPAPVGMPAAAPAVPAPMAAAPAVPVPAGMPATPAAVPAPNPAILNAPAAPAIPAVPAAAPVGNVKVLTVKAGGLTYEQMTSQGWTDASLIQHGYMAA